MKTQGTEAQTCETRTNSRTKPSLGDQTVLIENIAIDAIVTKCQRRFSIDPLDRSRQETPDDVQVAVLGAAVFGPETSGVGVAGGAGRILPQTSLIVHGNVLPVPVAANHHHVFLAADELPQYVALVLEVFVRVVVLFVLAVGADERGWAYQDPERRVGFPDCTLEPGDLLPAPDGFVRTVDHSVRAAEIAAFNEPYLQVPAPPDGAVRSLAHRDLFGKNAEAFLEGEIPHPVVFHGRPAVILPGVVVVLDKVTRHHVVKSALKRQGVHAVPFQAGQLNRVRDRPALVVVDDIARVDEETGLERLHQGVYLVAVLFVIAAMEPLPCYNREDNLSRDIRHGSGFETAFDLARGRRSGGNATEDCQSILRVRLQVFQNELTGEIAGWVDVEPRGFPFRALATFRPINNARLTGNAGNDMFHVSQDMPFWNLRSAIFVASLGSVAAGFFPLDVRPGDPIPADLRIPCEAGPDDRPGLRHLADLDPVGLVHGAFRTSRSRRRNGQAGQYEHGGNSNLMDERFRLPISRFSLLFHLASLPSFFAFLVVAFDVSRQQG